MDECQKDLAPLKSFVLPGGGPVGGFLHQARTVCRRAERGVLALSRVEDIGEWPLKYVNRLSDLFFVLSRWVGKHLGETEYLWERGLASHARKRLSIAGQARAESAGGARGLPGAPRGPGRSRGRGARARRLLRLPGRGRGRRRARPRRGGLAGRVRRRRGGDAGRRGPRGPGSGHRGGAPPRAGRGRAQAHVAAPGLPRARARAAPDGPLPRRGAGAGRPRAAAGQRARPAGGGGEALSPLRVRGDPGLQPQSAGRRLDGASGSVDRGQRPPGHAARTAAWSPRRTRSPPRRASRSCRPAAPRWMPRSRPPPSSPSSTPT